MNESLLNDGSEFKAKTQTQLETQDTLEALGREYAEVYTVARELFADSTYLSNLEVIVSYSSGTSRAMIMGNTNNDVVNPYIFLGNAPEHASRKAVEGIVTRLGADPEVLQRGSYTEALARYAIFAHEIGHIIQKDPAYAKLVGPIEPAPKIDSSSFTDEEYKEYVSASNEANADYFGATILAQCPDLNRFLKIAKPDEPIERWRDWAARRPVAQVDQQIAA